MNEFKLEAFALELGYIQRWLRENFDRNGDKNARVLDEDLARALKSYRALKRTYYRNNGKKNAKGNNEKGGRPSPTPLDRMGNGARP